MWVWEGADNGEAAGGEVEVVLEKWEVLEREKGPRGGGKGGEKEGSGFRRGPSLRWWLF